MLGINSIFGYYNLNKPSKFTIYIESDYSYLKLFNDLSYQIEIQRPHGRLYFTGKYSLENSKLKLFDTLIENKTKNRFTNEYLLNQSKKLFTPYKKKFEELKFVE